MKPSKRTKRRAMVLTGPNCGQFGTVSHIDVDEGTCRITYDNDERENKFLDDVEFVDDDASSDFGGYTPDEAALLEEMLG